MFQPAPRRHRRLPTGTGTMVSYAEVKSYLSKREIPQLFESLMAGLMYHRPENHIGYLQNCLEEVKANSDTKVQWSTFVNAKKRKSKEILPPLTPKKQDSFSSSWSDNSRQSTPLPPISARTRTRASLEQQDFRNTYILYHNPPPILAKPKVPVISILGGLGTRIDEVCEKVVRRLRGVVHISTCSMLKTRMTIEGFYRMTSVPACAVVDSVLQAMSMVQSADALLVAGFPRNRGDIEEYRSRKVRMDGVVLVDFEEEALRHFLEHEVASGIVRKSEVDAELERFKQDIISVAEYYDEKELLTVVMGDQDTEEIVEDLILAIDKIIETRKSILDEEIIDGKKNGECVSPCTAILPSPERLERPSTVEIRDATEEDIKSIEESNSAKVRENLEKEDNVDETLKANSEKSAEKSEDESNKSEVKNGEQISENENKTELEDKEEVKIGSEKEADLEESKDVESEKSVENNEEKGDHENESSNAGETAVSEDAKDNNSEKDEPIKSYLNNNSSEGSEINVKEDSIQSNKGDAVEKSEEAENDHIEKDSASDKGKQDPEEENNETALAGDTQRIPLVFSFENICVDSDDIRNLIANDLEMCFIDFQGLMHKEENNDDELDNDEALKMLKSILQKDSVSYSNGFFVYKLSFSLLNEEFIEQLLNLGSLNFVCKVRENKSDSLSESKDIEENKLFNSPFSEKIRIIFVTEDNVISELREALQEIIENKNIKTSESEIKTVNETKQDNSNEIPVEEEAEANESDDKEKQDTNANNGDLEDKISENENGENEKEENDVDEENEEKDVEPEIDGKEEILQDITEDSTGKDIEDLVTDTLNEESKLISGDNPAETEVDDTHSQASTLASAADETQRERAVLERQTGVELEAENNENDEADKSDKFKTSLIRQGTYSADEMKSENKTEEINEPNRVDDESKESKGNGENEAENISEGEKDTIDPSNKIENAENNATEPEQENIEEEKIQSQEDLNAVEEEVVSGEQAEAKDKEVEVEETSSKEEAEQNKEINQDEASLEPEENKSAENTEKETPLPEDEEKLEQTDSAGKDIREGEGNNSVENADEDVKEESDSKKDEEEDKNENNSEKGEEQKEVLSEKETDHDDSKHSSPDDEKEKTADNDGADNQLDVNKTEQCLDANSEEGEKSLENNNENSEPKNNECSEKSEPSKNEAEEPVVNEAENSEHSPDSSQKNENDEESNGKSKQESNNSEEKKDEKTKSDASHKLDSGIRKAMDNDSDSNDENITIETKAEVHAVDCASPSAPESEKSKCKEEENVKSDAGDAENENSADDNKDENSSDKNKLNEMDNGSLVGNNNDSETLEIRDSIESERLSGKRQERNGSGILDESRAPDPTEMEEPQERSSSSSRGEL